MMGVSPEEQLRAIAAYDDVCRANLLAASDGGLASMFAIADAQVRLSEAFTPAIMAMVMRLMGSELGFLTDRDREEVKYSQAVVKECVIAAALKGLRITGNEFNIIAGKCYQAVSGTFRKIREFPGLANFESVEEIPQNLAGGEGAAVKITCTWKLSGMSDTLSGTYLVKVNKSMGIDAVLGKAKHRAYRKVWARLSGMPLEPHPDDDRTVEGTATVATEPAQEQSKTETTAAAAAEGPTLGRMYLDELGAAKTIADTGRVYDSWCGPESTRELPEGFDAWAAGERNRRNGEIRGQVQQ